jgi:hypothetical protein
MGGAAAGSHAQGIAVRVALVELLVLAILVAVVALGADDWFGVPLLAASPLVAIELWFDMRSRGRRLLPELAGTVGIGSVAAAISLADRVGPRLVDRRHGARCRSDPVRPDTGLPRQRQLAPRLAPRPCTGRFDARQRADAVAATTLSIPGCRQPS